MMNNNLMNMYQMFMQNPTQMLSRKFNLPQRMSMNNPNDIVQYLLNTGQVSQQQVNQIKNMMSRR